MEKTSDDDLQAILDDNDGSTYGRAFVQALARELLEERKQPKVWDDARSNIESGEFATLAWVEYRNKDGTTDRSKNYIRDIPKTPIREIAEKYCKMWDTCDESITGKSRIDITEMAITEAMALKA